VLHWAQPWRGINSPRLCDQRLCAHRPRPRPAACSGPIRWRSSLKNTIYDVLRSKKEWQETDHPTDWDFFWADKG
jgi:hypothetical protein